MGPGAVPTVNGIRRLVPVFHIATASVDCAITTENVRFATVLFASTAWKRVPSCGSMNDALPPAGTMIVRAWVPAPLTHVSVRVRGPRPESSDTKTEMPPKPAVGCSNVGGNETSAPLLRGCSAVDASSELDETGIAPAPSAAGYWPGGVSLYQAT